MRILKVTASYAPFFEFGGPPVKVQALAEGLTRRGHRVTVLTADWGLAERGGGQRTTFGLRREENGVEALYLAPGLPAWLRYRSLTWYPGAARFCRERLREFDAVHIYGLYDLLGPRVAAACRAGGVAYAVEPMGMYLPIVRSVRLKRAYHALFGRALISGARAVIATSEQEAAELAGGGVEPGRILLRRNGVALPGALPPRGQFRAAHGIASDAQVVLFLGRLASKKSPELLLRAFAHLAGGDDAARLRLVFAGPDDENMMKRLRESARLLGIRKGVIFAGPLFGESKWSAYRDADVFVLPSQNENFGNAAAEALAAGTPVIVTETCGIAALLAEGAGVIVPHDEAALTGALQRVLHDAALRERLQAGGAALLPRLGWEEPVREMEQLYERLGRRP
ncbi:MAG: glycosyltransferase [Acidobacteriia bacterium]|nr:glycosyltransferase [Terriglobia bacterium]